MPNSFKESYPNTRVIIDCTELFISQPRSQSATFSSCKNHNTGKGLIGISPRGDLTCISELYAGNTSDKQLTNDGGIIKLLEPGDAVMADREFEIADDLPLGVALNIPPFLGEQEQFSEEDEIKTRRIAKHDSRRTCYPKNKELPHPSTCFAYLNGCRFKQDMGNLLVSHFVLQTINKRT